MSVLFVTGTGTDVGKTIATAAIASTLKSRGVSVSVVKPAQTGESPGHGDLATIQRLTGVESVHEFARYPDPLAPATAARRAKMELLDLETVAGYIRRLDKPGRVVLVEGAGGLLVRIGDNWNLADLAARVPRSRMVVVTSMGLGSLNMAELTVEAAKRRGLQVVGLIGGSMPAEPDLAMQENQQDLPAVTGVPLLAVIPEGVGALSPQQFQESAASWFEVPAGSVINNQGAFADGAPR